jgi:hypothetical protein
MDLHLEYLRSYLAEEFEHYPNVRIRVPPGAGTQKAVDLIQDYDPEVNDIHLRRGVTIYANTREYFFPVQWVAHKQFDEIKKLAEKIREMLDVI